MSTTGGMSHPTVLPFSLVSYDGSKPADEDTDPIVNVLSADPELVHCSRDGHNFNLLLQYTPSLTAASASCTLTHVVIHGPTNCTAPIATGIVFASLDKPDIASYTHKYDDITRQQYEELPLSTLQSDGAVAFFALTDLDRLQIAVTLPSWTECRYLHIKLISARSEVDDNIDVARIAAAGFDTAQRPAEETTLPATVPQQLGLMKEELGRWNRLSPDHMRALREEPACILFGSDPMKPETTAARTLLHAIAMSDAYDGSLTFYHYDDSSSDKTFADAVADMAGLPPVEAQSGQQQTEEGAARPANSQAVAPKRPPAAIVITELDNNRRYHYSGPLDDAAIRAWLNEYVAGTLVPFVKSQPRPTGDVDVNNVAVTVVTAGTFDELVLVGEANDKSVLLFVLSNDENELVSAVVRCWVYAVADVVRLPQLRVALFDADSNDVPSSVLSSSVPGIVLFPSHDKQAVARLTELPTPRSLLRFLQKQLPSLDVDMDVLVQSPRFEAAFAYTCLLLDCQQALQNNASPAETLRWALAADEKDRLLQMNETVARALQALIVSGAGDDELQRNARAALKEMEDEYSKHQPLVEEVEACHRLMSEVGEHLRGATDALSEEELSKLSEALGYASLALPRETPESKTHEPDSTADSKQASESESKADEDVKDEAARQWQEAKTAPFSRERLQTNIDKLRQVFDGVKDKLAARQAELAAKAEGRVLKCHSAAELSAALTAAAAGHQLTVIDFTAVWCGPCKHAAPIFGQLSVQHTNVRFVKVDVDECEDVRDEYGVEAMPTFVFIRDGSELREYRIQGANVKALTRAIALLSATDAPQIESA